MGLILRMKAAVFLLLLGLALVGAFTYEQEKAVCERNHGKMIKETVEQRPLMQTVSANPDGNAGDEMQRRRLLQKKREILVAVPQQKRQETCVQQGCPDICPKFGDENNEGCCPTRRELPYCCVNPTKPCRTCDCGVEAQDVDAPDSRRRRLLSLMRAKMQGGSCWWCAMFH